MNRRDDHGDFTPLTRIELKRIDVAELVRVDALLRTAPLVKALGDASDALLKLSQGRRYPDRAPICGQGEPGDSLCLVLKGEARLFARTGKDVVELGAARKGEVFGEAEVLDGSGRRTMSAVALGEVDLVDIPRAALLDAAKGRPGILEELQQLRDKRRAALDEMAAFLDRW